MDQMKQLANELRIAADQIENSNQKIKDIIADELIEELNKLDIFILSSLQLDLDNRRGPICSLEDCLIEYNSDDHSMQTKNIPSKYTFEDYLIKTIEKTCIEKA